MMIRIAAITPEDFASRIMAHEGTEGNLKIIPYYYKNPMQTNELVKQVEECDVLLFAGPLPLFFAQQQIAEKRWPVVYIPSDEYTLTLTLAHILVHRKEGLQRLSIDIPKAEYVRQAANELQLDVSQWSIKDYGKIIDGHGNTFNADEIIRFHLNNWRTGQAQLVLTSVDYVYEQLTLASVPCISMIVPEKSIRETVLQASHYGQLMISKNAQIAVGLAAVNQSEDRLESMAPDARIMLQQMLLELGTETDASIQQLGMDQFIIYGTRGSIEKMTDNFQVMPLLGRMEQLFGVTVSLGFGFGLTAKEAEANARIGLYHARKHPTMSSTYLVTDQKEVIGPLHAGTKSYQLKSENPEILHVADTTGISVATINKLTSFVKLRRENRFTAADLADYLQVSRRSAERMLKKLTDHHFVKAVGEEQPYQQGRPRAVYRITF